MSEESDRSHFDCGACQACLEDDGPCTGTEKLLSAAVFDRRVQVIARSPEGRAAIQQAFEDARRGSSE